MSIEVRAWSLAVALSALFSAQTAAAATCTWAPTSGTNWSTAANWSCSAVPTSGDDAVFPTLAGGGYHVVTVDVAGATAHTMAINGVAYDFEASGAGTLSITGEMSFGYVGPATTTFNVPIAASGDVLVATSDSTQQPSFHIGSLTTHAGTLTFSGPGYITINQAIDGDGGIAYDGSGTLTLASANSFTGVTTVSNGKVVASDPASLGTDAGGTVVTGTGYLDLSPAGSFSESLTVGSSASPAVLFERAATLTAPLVLTGATEIRGTALVVSQPITETAPSVLTLSGGTVELQAANSYSGGTIIAPNVDVTADNSLSFGAGRVTIESGGAVTLGNAVQVGNNFYTTGTGVGNGIGAISATGDASISGNIVASLGSYAAIGVAADAGVLVISGLITTDDAGSGSSYNGLSKFGPGMLLLTGSTAETYTGGTTINDGTLDLGPRPNMIPPTWQVYFGNSGTPTLAVHANTTLSSVASGANARILLDHGAVLTHGSYAGGAFGGIVSGDGGVTFTGVASGYPLTWSNTSTYTGPTVITGPSGNNNTIVQLNGATASVVTNGSFPNSPIALESYGSLYLGPGSVVGPIVGSGGTLVPVAGTPQVVNGSLNLGGGSIFFLTYGGVDAGQSPLLIVDGGGVSISGCRLETQSSTAYADLGPVVVLRNDGTDAAIVGTFSGLPEGAIVSPITGAGLLKVSYVGGDGNDITLQVYIPFDAGVDSGVLVDAGFDSGVTGDAFIPIDSGVDSTVADTGAPDATDATTDSLLLLDAMADAEAPDASGPHDATVDAFHTDAALPFDAADYADAIASFDGHIPVDAGFLLDGGLPDASDFVPPSIGKGCSCDQAGSRHGSPLSVAPFALAALALLVARRRRSS